MRHEDQSEREANMATETGIDDYLSSIIQIADTMRDKLTPYVLAQSDEMALLIQEVRRIDNAIGNTIGIIEEIEQATTICPECDAGDPTSVIQTCDCDRG